MIRAVFGLLALALAVGCYLPEVPPDEPGRMAQYPLQRVRRVLSGDTILLEDGATGRRVRYAGVEAPDRGSSLWSAAKAENARLVEGQEVRVIPVEHPGEDAWGYVFVPNSTKRIHLMVQFELARAGLVRVAEVPHNLDDEYFDGIQQRAEEARKDRRGLYAPSSDAR